MEIITRTEAKEKGLTHYFTGKPCKHGHISEKTVSGGNCVECYKVRYWGDRERPKKHSVPKHLQQYLITRKEARQIGQTTYFTGQPCKRGHIAAKWTSSAQCVVCEKEKNAPHTCCNKYAPFRSTAEYREVYQKKYVEKNAQKIRDRTRAYQQNNKERYLEYQNAYQAARRVLLRQAQPPWVNIGKLKPIYRLMRKKNKAAGQVVYHVDHIVPLQGKDVCGLHVPWNLQIITAKENQAKHNKMPEEFYGLGHKPPTHSPHTHTQS
jgi:hypothetical protein